MKADENLSAFKDMPVAPRRNPSRARRPPPAYPYKRAGSRSPSPAVIDLVSSSASSSDSAKERKRKGKGKAPVTQKSKSPQRRKSKSKSKDRSSSSNSKRERALRQDFERDWSHNALTDDWQRVYLSRYNPDAATYALARPGRELLDDQVRLHMLDNGAGQHDRMMLLEEHGFDDPLDYYPNVPLYKQTVYQRRPRTRK